MARHQKTSRYDRGWPAYVPAAERRKKAEQEVGKRLKQGQSISPVTIDGREIVTTFWGKAWCDNLEGYGDFESRLPRGRAYVRNGSVLDLQVSAGNIKATVSGSDIYAVSVKVTQLPAARWRSICADCVGGIDSLVELLQGRLSKGVMERICRQDGGLFPRPSEITFSCDCYDYASMCKHVAAVMYGVGARLDQRPELLFQLRGVDETELIAGMDGGLPLSNAAPAADRVLISDDLSALFGLDMGSGEPAAAAPVEKPAGRKAGTKRRPLHAGPQ
jgi:uncharacterized Zn finger protein